MSHVIKKAYGPRIPRLGWTPPEEEDLRLLDWSEPAPPDAKAEQPAGRCA